MISENYFFPFSHSTYFIFFCLFNYTVIVKIALLIFFFTFLYVFFSSVSFEVDADIEVAAMEASVAASRAQIEAVNTWTVRPTRRTNPRGAVTLPWEVSDNTHDRRSSTTRNANRARSVEASAGNVFGEEDDDNDDFGESLDAFRTENTGGSTRNNTTAAGPYSGRSARSSASAGATAAAATPVVVPVMEIPSAVVARRNSAPLVSARVVGEGQLSNVAVAVPATPRQVLNGLVVAEAYVQNS